jgi:hypothetical protein
MLYLVSKPIPMTPGTYTVSSIQEAELTELIREAAANQQLESRIHFQSSATALRTATGVNIRTTSEPGQPYIQEGDLTIEVRLKPGTQGKRIGFHDLEFVKIRYSSGWPAIVND